MHACFDNLSLLEAGPLMDDLHDAAGQEAEVSAGRADLGSVGHEDGAGEVADHAAAQVDDSHAPRPRHLLQVPHQPVLEGHRDQEVEYPEIILFLNFQVLFGQHFPPMMRTTMIRKSGIGNQIRKFLFRFAIIHLSTVSIDSIRMFGDARGAATATALSLCKLECKVAAAE